MGCGVVSKSSTKFMKSIHKFCFVGMSVLLASTYCNLCVKYLQDTEDIGP